MSLRLPSALLCCLLVVACWCTGCQEKPESPAPIPLAQPSATEGEDGGRARAAWIELMHTGGQDVDWRAYEQQNQASRRQKFEQQAAEALSTDELFPGFRGSWAERGSTNQAGNVVALAYDSLSNGLYAVSGGGTLWWGEPEGDEWRVVDQRYQFENNALEVFHLPGGRRILAAIDAQPHYSDDGGATWQRATGIPRGTDFWSGLHDFVEVKRPGQTSLLLTVGKQSFQAGSILYSSTDYGETWSSLVRGVGDDLAEVKLVAPPGMEAALLVLGGLDRVYRVTEDGWEQIPSNLADEFNLTDVWFAGGPSGDSLILYLVDDERCVLRSVDTAQTWACVGYVPKFPWRVGLYVDPADARNLAMGEVELYLSTDAGEQWERVNRWQDYYRDVFGSIHADIMSFETFFDEEGVSVTAIGNHGGVSTTLDWFETTENIGMLDLNVGQYYSVRSHPNFPDHFFAGSQDQGLQRGSGAQNEAVPMEQLLSGDYGHLTFAEGGQALYAVYPFIDVMYWPDALGNEVNVFRLPETSGTVWLTPMVADPRPGKQGVLIAGGSNDGQLGSYVVSLDHQNDEFVAEDLPTDFFDESGGGTLSALGTAPTNDSLWYAATTNGRFFVSADAGGSWDQTINFIPDGHYLYGQAIEGSPVRDSTVWLAGNGYNNPPVYRSDNAGNNFRPASDGLPSTLVYDLAASSSGELLFAATEAGPFVYVEAEERWFDLATPETPVQRYWSVEWVAADSVARFGTYGRGVWDLALSAQQEPSVGVRTAATVEVRAFPNPTTQRLTLTAAASITDVRAYALDGREMLLGPIERNGKTMQLSVADWPAATYLLQIETLDGRGTARVVKR